MVIGSDEPEPSWLELKDFQLGSARDLFCFSSDAKIGQKRAENWPKNEPKFNSQLKTYFWLIFIINLAKFCS